MVLTLAFECWVFADYLPSSFVRGRLASLTSQLVTALHPIDSVVPLTFALAPSASSTCRLCPGCLLVLMPSGPAATALGPRERTLHHFTQKAIHRLALLGAAWRSPSRFARSPLPALFAPRPLRDMPVDHLKRIACSAKLFVGSTPGVSDEREIGVSVLAKPLRHVLAVPRRRGGQAQPYYRVARLFQPALKLRLAVLLALMEHLEQLLQCRPQCFAVAAVARGSGSVVRNFTSRIRWARQNCTRMSHFFM